MGNEDNAIDACDAPLLELHIQISLIWNERKKLRADIKQMKGFIQMALDELGISNKDYPANVANAVDFLNETLKAPAAIERGDF